MPVADSSFSNGEADSQSTNLGLLAQIKIARGTADCNHAAIGEMLEKWRVTVGLSPTAVAEICEVSPSTFYRWVAGDPIPHYRIEKLHEYFRRKALNDVTSNSIIYRDHRVTIRTLDDLLDRQDCCKRVWSIKNVLPYRSAKSGVVQNRLFDYLIDSNSENHFNCIFFGVVKEDEANYVDYPAQVSFAEFKKRLHEEHSDKSGNLRGWLISNPSLAFDLGITNNPIGIHVLEYSREKTPKTAPWSGREVDIFYEIPLALYQRDNPQKLYGGEESLWLELGPQSSSWDWLERKQKFVGLEEGLYADEGAQEFLKSDKEIRDFIIHRR